MTSRLREAAGLLIEQGRALAKAEDMHGWAVTLATLLDKARQIPTAEQRLAWLVGQIESLQGQQAAGDAVYRGIATSSRAAAEALVAELEHPGARLARRLLASWRGARAAWRGSR